jgi:membrane-bound acyltransferase YfiQ involved in biofilm formation
MTLGVFYVGWEYQCFLRLQEKEVLVGSLTIISFFVSFFSSTLGYLVPLRPLTRSQIPFHAHSLTLLFFFFLADNSEGVPPSSPKEKELYILHSSVQRSMNED